MKLRGFFTPKIHFKYYYHKDTSRMVVAFVLFNKCLFKKTIYPLKKPKKPQKKFFKKFQKYLLKYSKSYYKRILKAGEIQYIFAGSNLGIEDAALTAFFTGELYSVYGSVFGILSSYISLKNIVIQVNPVYNRFYFDLNFQCILRIKKANAIKEIFRFIVWIIKEKMEAFKNERTSDMRSYDHGYAKH